MPAKRGVKSEQPPATPAKRARVTGKQQKASPGPGPQQPSDDTCVNAKLQYHLAQCDSKVLSHPVFSGIADMEPTDLSGHLPYNASVAAEKLGGGKDYVASCPLFLVEHGLRAPAKCAPIPKPRNRIAEPFLS